MNGNDIYTDSFDSTDPSKSTGGLYDYAKRQTKGNVATNSTLSNSLTIGNADIYGEVATGAGGTVKMGKNGSVGPTLVEGDRATTVEDGEDKGEPHRSLGRSNRHDKNGERMPSFIAHGSRKGEERQVGRVQH